MLKSPIEERAHKALQGQNQILATTKLEDGSQNEAGSVDIPLEQVPTEAKDDQVDDALKHDTVLVNPEDNDQDPMGLSILDNMEISMVHVLPAEFQPTTHQQNYLDRDWLSRKQHKSISSLSKKMSKRVKPTNLKQP
ncbi:hypothetical protein ACFX11_000233 [Malus domestica]